MVADHAFELHRCGLGGLYPLAAHAAAPSGHHQRGEQDQHDRGPETRDGRKAVPAGAGRRCYLRHVSAEDMAKFQIAPTKTPATPATHQRSFCPASQVPMPILASAPTAEIA